MHRFLTIVQPRSAAGPALVRVTFPSAATVHDLRAALGEAGVIGVGAGSTLYAGAEPLDGTARVAAAPLFEGTTLSTDPAGSQPGDDQRSPLHLHVTSGPDAGQIFPLGLGAHRLGRSAEATLRIQDDTLSRSHALVGVSAAGTAVHDLHSTNGSLLDGRPLGPGPTPWAIGKRLAVGSSVLELSSHGYPSAATTSDTSGHTLVNRRPRVPANTPVVEIRLPTKPDPGRRGRLPVLTMIVPLLLAVPMAMMQHAPTYLLFGAMSPVMMLGSWFSERRGGRRDGRRLRQQWAIDQASAELSIARALRHEAERRRSALPDCALLLLAAATPLDRLWERRCVDQDALVVRIGLSDLPAKVHVLDPATMGPPETPLALDVPVGVDLRAAGVLGITGSPEHRTGLARSLVAQLAGWHSPREVQLLLLTEDTRALANWMWALLLPHLEPPQGDSCHRWVASLGQGGQVRQRVQEVLALMDDRLAGRGEGPGSSWSGPCIVVVLDGARRLRAAPGLSRLLDQGPLVGIYAIALEANQAGLPVECKALVRLTGPDGGSATCADLLGVDGDRLTLVPDVVGASWADRFGRALAPLRDATSEPNESGPPERARLLDLLGDSQIGPGQLEAAWTSNGRSWLATIGIGVDGPYVVDLRHDGPHLLIGGTTGSGKSELLQTLIASLALHCSPAELAFVLVDYKGGSAFEQCSGLPHTVGLVTDLDPHLAERALRSLTAEIKRRERLLRDVAAKDIDDYAAKVGATGPGLARLVLVIDEFKMLAEELPSFLEGMVRLAALGRSLGVHLVLATQRPAGIVSADIAANVNLRIALRVRDQVDSEDVIEARDAAGISSRTPGRAYARSGSNPLVLFQTARVAGSASTAEPGRCLVEPLSASTVGDRPRQIIERTYTAQDTDLARIVEAACRAAETMGINALPSPWLPTLPDVITLDQLAPAPGGWRVPYAVVDQPEQQRQETLSWDLAHDTHLAVVGTMRSGRSSLLRTIAGSIAGRFTPAQVHLHAIDDGSGALRALRRLPHAGVVAGCQETGRTVRLLDRLTEEVTLRRAALGANGFSSLDEQHACMPPDQRLPYIVLLLDGWENLTASWESVEHGRPSESLHQLMRDGAGVGIRVALAGDRGLLMSRVSALVRDKVVLRLADPTDLTLAGIPAAALPSRWPAGRGVRVVDHAEIQVALLDPEPSGPAQFAALERIASVAASSNASVHAPVRPLRIEPLPTAVTSGELQGRALDAPTGWALVGAGGDAAEPLGLSLAGSSALVAGPGKSGRSTALCTMAGWLGQHGTPVVAVVAGRSALTELGAHPGVVAVLDRTEPVRLRDVLAEGGECCVVIDDVERLVDTEVEDVVLQWFKSPDRVTGSLLVAGNSADLAAQFRGLSVVARRSGLGVLLNPTSYADGELLGVRILAAEPADLRPGRGLLVQNGTSAPIQVAH